MRLILLVSLTLTLTPFLAACNSGPTVAASSVATSPESKVTGQLQSQRLGIPVLIPSHTPEPTPPDGVTRTAASIGHSGQENGGDADSAPAIDSEGGDEATSVPGAVICFDDRFPVVSDQVLAGMAATDPEIAETVASKVDGVVTQRYFKGRIVLISFDAAKMGLGQAIGILSADPHVRYAEPNAIVSIHNAPKCNEDGSGGSPPFSSPDDALEIAP